MHSAFDVLAWLAAGAAGLWLIRGGRVAFPVQPKNRLSYYASIVVGAAIGAYLFGTMNLIALLLIPDDLRMKEYYDNWMGGLAMQMIGPVTLRLALNAFVV